MLYCLTCSAKLKEEQKTCTKCGQRVSVADMGSASQ